VWEGLLASDPNALASHTPAWIDFVCCAGGYEDASRLYELPGGRRVVLPMVRRPHLPDPLAEEASFPPAWGIGGLVAPGGVRLEDASAVFADLSGRGLLRASLRPNPLDAEVWGAAQPSRAIVRPRLAHVLSLEGGLGKVWKERFRGNARTAVRKAERCGITVQCDTSGTLVPVVQALFERSVRRWAEQQHEPLALARWRSQRRDPQRKLELMTQVLGEACRVWVAWSQGQPAAAIVVLQGRNAHETRGMMNVELAGPTRANYLLHMLAIEQACAAGCRNYHMGETGTSSSLAQFKTRFGARPHPYAEYHLERLPITALDRRARSVVKRVIGFRDYPGGATDGIVDGVTSVDVR